MNENTTASGAADLPEFPGHPEPQIMMWNALEIVAIRKYGADMFRAGRLAASAPVAPTPPDWRELCRRLYVELFHCDKQMTCSLNEDGEPIWRTGTEVRDVLSDAKAALEANPITPEAAPVAPTQEAEAVRWEFRWLNPGNNPYSPPSEMAWKLVEPKGMQPLEATLSDLRAYRYAGNPCYEVRPLFAQAAPVAPAPITEAEQAAWHAGLDEGRSQVCAPLQQGEYPEPQQDSDDPASLGAYLAAWAGGVHSRTKNDTGAAEEWISVSVERLGHAAAALIAARGADSRIAELEAARIAYASEFPPDANGDPDIGNIHSNIRALKARGAAQPEGGAK